VSEEPPCAAAPSAPRTLDGAPYRIRAIRPDDADRERAFIRDLSEESRHNRFMCTFRDAPQALIDQFVHANDDEHAFALVAVTGDPGCERIIGVARYAVTDELAREAEWAITVADEWQSRGIGTTLVRALLEQARTRGLRRLYAPILQSNAAVQQLAHYLGFTIRPEPGTAGVLEASITLGRV
jgi:acetyltransferase